MSPRSSNLPAPEERTLTALRQIPWCAELLDDKHLTAYISPSRRVKPDGADILFNLTLNTPATISEYVALYQQPENQDNPIMELKAIISLGTEVTGFPNVCHGGIVATLLDEVMGELINVNLKHRTIKRTSYMTGYLNTSYKGKVTTPGTYLVVARMAKVDGRKLFISAAVEDGKGTVLAKGEALFIGLREPIGRL
ncbi:HotDog domain-containing protein [Coniochaeta sp. 2T2.1]|nr:HotDog domain-containing protein [Coniochaeta sp. 2T2.1]